ncbi:hypothetical protein ACFL59_16295, partial [Planctomycetota bacterium]
LRARRSDGSNDRRITSQRPGQVGTGFYYMRCAGYWIVPVVEAGGHRVEIHTENNVRTVGRINLSTHCDTIEVVPSADGSMLAQVVTRGGCTSGPPTPGGPPPTVTEVTFLDPQTLTELSAQTLFGVGAGVKVVWTLTGTFDVVAPTGEVWSLDPVTGSAQQTNMVPSCMVPKTTSSFIAADYRTVVVENGNVVVGRPGQYHTGAQPYGCGAHGSLNISCP